MPDRRMFTPQAQRPEPFKGITAAGAIEPGLFPLKTTGVSTAPVREAAQRFLIARMVRAFYSGANCAVKCRSADGALTMR